MIGISHLLRRVSQVWVTIGALVQQLILLVASYSSKWDFYCCLCLSSFSVFPSSLHRLRLLSQFRILSPIFLFRSLDSFSFSRVLFFRIISPSFSWSLSFTFDQIAPLWTENMWLEVVMLVHTAIYHVQTHPPNTTAISNSLKYPKKNHTITAHQ